MPAAAFFRHLGLFVLPDFLDAEYRVDLCRRIAAAPVERAIVAGPHEEGHLDLGSRKVDWCFLPEEVKARLEQRLLEIQPALGKHFGLGLVNCESPQFLIYRPGDFFKAHQDAGGYGLKEVIRRRRVSVVIFLNRQSQEPAEGAYGQGDLTFYGLLEGPQWEKCAFPLAGRTRSSNRFPVR